MSEQQLPATTQQSTNMLPFASQAQAAPKASERIEMQRATAQVMASFQMAIQYPRDEQKCYERIMDLCKNVGFASDAMYKITNRGEGLTVKAAKAMARIWGNLDSGYVEHGGYGSESQMEAYCYDLETNFSYRARFTVSHFQKANGQLVEKTDPADISVLCKARASKEVRNAILSVMPDWIEEEVQSAVLRTLHSTVHDVPAAFNAFIKTFAGIGVVENSLWRYINKRPGTRDKFEKVDAADIIDLRLLKKGISEDPKMADIVFPERDKSKKLPEKNAPEDQEAAPPAPPAEKKVATELPKSQKTSSTPSSTPSTSSTKEDSKSESSQTGSKPSGEKSADPKQQSTTTEPSSEQSEQSSTSADETTSSNQNEENQSQTAAPSANPPVKDMF